MKFQRFIVLFITSCSTLHNNKSIVTSQDFLPQYSSISSFSTMPSSSDALGSESASSSTSYHDAVFNSRMEEYDAWKFDPESMFGSPYGGFGRATKSRLAALPLRLVTSSTSSPSSTPTTSTSTSTASIANGGGGGGDGIYFTMRDGEGRQFACRIYNEHELENDSYSDSMFEIARERRVSDVQVNTDDSSVSDNDSDSGSGSEINTESGKNTDSTTDSSTGTSTDDRENPKEEEDELKEEEEEEEEDEKLEMRRSYPSLESTSSASPKASPKESETKSSTTTSTIQSTTSTASTTSSTSSSKETTTKPSPPSLSPKENLKKDITEKVLSNLDGMCAQLHKDWWSYEWCYESTLVQFHIALKNAEDGHGSSDPDQITTVVIENMTPLGNFATRDIIFDDDDDKSDTDDSSDTGSDVELTKSSEKTSSSFDKDNLSSIKIMDTYKDGKYCEEANNFRKVNVHLSCCQKEDHEKGLYQEHQLGGAGGLFGNRFTQGPTEKRKNDQVTKDISVIFQKIEEHKTCEYTATICTSLLCDPIINLLLSDDEDDDSESNSNSKGGTPPNPDEFSMFTPSRSTRSGSSSSLDAVMSAGTFLKKKKAIKSDDSVRDILDRALGVQCLSMNIGWWTYGFCHKTQIYQFHENISLDPITAKTNSKIESRYVLGKYDTKSSDGFPVEDESKHMYFPHRAATSNSNSNSHTIEDEDIEDESYNSPNDSGMADAYYTQNYYHGDTCEDSDVVGSAIKGGKLNDGKIERSSTVRFFCGSQKAIIRIDEDSTCHYIIDISVPELCIQKFFEVPHLKTQIVKCLPVD